MSIDLKLKNYGIIEFRIFHTLIELSNCFTKLLSKSGKIEESGRLKYIRKR